MTARFCWITNSMQAIWLAALLCLSSTGWATQSQAQNLFAPVAKVNGSAITRFDVEQRIALLKMLRTGGDLQAEALKRLVNEKLQLDAARVLGIVLTDDEVATGVDEFAGRNNLTGEQLIAAITNEGIDPNGFRQFVKAGLAWRQLVGQRFSGTVFITDAEVDRALNLLGTQGSVRVLFSEIFLPTNNPKNAAITAELAPQIAALRTIAEFSDAARRFSAAPSRERGGRVPGWVKLEEVPALIRPLMLTMRPGEVTDPVEIPNAVGLFQLRAREEFVAPVASNPTLDYASYLIAGGRSPAALAQAAKVRASVDVCDDLYEVARKQPPEVLERTLLPSSEIPRGVAQELARLDAGEVSTALTRANGQTLVFLMLCERTRAPETPPTRDQMRQRLTNLRLNELAAAYLLTLRADAIISLP
ncbi:MAG: peptidylprolyl isomerase [Marinosulfonomonas sp.]|nr:peptidylprolyl isomerase [Marinosulfonomonas sp.]